MDQPLEVSDMPVLTDAEHTQLRAMESELRGNLDKYVRGYSVHDEDAAFEYVRTAAVKFYDFFYRKYSNHPDQTYRPHSRPASEKFAYQRVVRCLHNFSALESFLDRYSRSTRLKKTISEHATLLEPRLIKPVIDSPIVPGLWAPTDTPILRMAKSIKFLDPVASKRQAFVHPRLDAKGWDIPQWAKEANVSPHTARDYLNAKRKTTHSNLRELANALGVSFQDLPK